MDILKRLRFTDFAATALLVALFATAPTATRAAVQAPGAHIDKKLPVINAMELDRDPTWGEKVKMHFGQKLSEPEMSFAKNPELLDTLWGQYFATGDYRPWKP